MRGSPSLNHGAEAARTLLLLVSTALTACAAGPGDSVGAITPWHPQANRNGDPVFGAYESRVPCLDAQGQHSAGCERLKLALVLYRHLETGRPTTYLMSRVYVGSSDERFVDEGAWTIETATVMDTRAAVYALDSHAPADLRTYWVLSQDVLFVLDQDRVPRRGTAGYGYALNRVDARAAAAGH